MVYDITQTLSITHTSDNFMLALVNVWTMQYFVHDPFIFMVTDEKYIDHHPSSYPQISLLATQQA